MHLNYRQYFFSFFSLSEIYLHKSFLDIYQDKTVGFALKVPRELLIDIVFIGIIDSAAWLNVYVTEQGRFASFLARGYSCVSLIFQNQHKIFTFLLQKFIFFKYF